MPFNSEKQRKWMHANKPKMAKKWEKEEESINEMPNFDRGTSGLPRGFIDDYNKIIKKLSKGKGWGTLSRSDKKKVWATLGKKYNESVNEGDLGLTYKKGKTVKVKHKTSGKSLVIIDKPNVRKEYEKIGFYAESVNEVSGVDVAKKVLKNKQYEKGIDLQTANLIVTIYKAYDKNPKLQKKFRAIPLPKMKQLVMKYYG